MEFNNENLRVIKATSLSNEPSIFMELLNGENHIEPVKFISRSEGKIKDWTLDDSLIIQREDESEIVFKIHGNKGPVYLVTEQSINGKTRKVRVTFYTSNMDGVVKKNSQPKERKKRAATNKTPEPVNYMGEDGIIRDPTDPNSEYYTGDSENYVITCEDRGYKENGEPIQKPSEPLFLFEQREQRWKRKHGIL